MYNCLTYLPFIKPLISDFLSQYIGIDINLETIGLLSENTFDLDLKDIEANPRILNSLLLKHSNIKIMSFSIGQIKLGINLNSVNLTVSKIKLIMIPVIDNTITPQKTKNHSKTNCESKIKNDNNSNKSNSGGFKKAILNFIFKGINVEINDIDIYMLNYEPNEFNMILTNPCLSVHLPCIKFYVDQEYNGDNIENFYDGKMLIIENILINISKSFKEKTNINIDENDEFVPVEIYETVFALNPRKGICLHTNVNNNFTLDFGDMQLLLNMFQVDLLKNFIENYLSYFTSENQLTNSNETYNHIHKHNHIHNKQINKTNNNNDDEAFTNDEKKILLCLNVNLDSLSVILLESFYSEDKPKFYNYDPFKFKDHFCYFEDNFLLFSLTNMQTKITSYTSLNNNQSLFSLLEFYLNEMSLSYIEYKSKKKVETFSSINTSIYEEASSTLFNTNNSKYTTSYRNNTLTLEEINQYKYAYIDNNIFNLNVFKVTFDLTNNQLNSEIDGIKIGIHPAYLFKMLKIIYDNSIFIKEIFFYNKDKINETHIRKSLYDTVNSQELKLNSYERNNYQRKKFFDENKFNTNKEQNDNNNNNKHKVTNTCKININFLLKKIDIKILCFKPEKQFSSTITPFFTEFYYDCIYILQMNQYKKMELKTVTSNDFIALSVTNIKLTTLNTIETIELNIDDIKLFFNVYQLFYIKNGLKIKLENNIHDIQIETNLQLLVEFNLVDELLAFINIWRYSLQILNIFKKRMKINYSKGSKEIYLMYNGHNKPKCKIKKDNAMKPNDNKNKLNSSEINIKVSIPLIVIQLKYENSNKSMSGFGKDPLIQVKGIKCNFNLNNESNIKLLFEFDNIEGEEIFKIIKFNVSFEMYKKLIENNIKKEDSENAYQNNNNDFIKKRDHHLLFSSIHPGKYLNTYILQINDINHKLELEEKKQLNQLHKYKEKQSSHKTILNIKVFANIEHLFIDPIQLLVYSHNVFNSILQSKFKNKSYFQRTKNSTLTFSQASKQIFLNSSNEALLQIEANQLKNNSSLTDSNFTNNSQLIQVNENNIEKENSIELNFSFKLDKMQMILGKSPYLCIEMYKLYLNNSNSSIEASFDLLSININYLEQNQEISANLLKITNTNTIIKLPPSILLGQVYNSITIDVNIKSISGGICRDSLSYLLSFIDKLKKLLKKISFEIPNLTQSSDIYKSFDVIEMNDISKNENTQTNSNLSQSDSNTLNNLQQNISSFSGYNNSNKNHSPQNQNQTTKNKIITFNIKIELISFTLYQGEDLSPRLNVLSKQTYSDFEDISNDSIYYTSNRKESNYVSLKIEDIITQATIDFKTLYKSEFVIWKLYIEDTLEESDFKYMLNRSTFTLDDSKPFLKIELEITNSSINKNQPTDYDYNIICFIEIISFSIMIHQKTLYFIMDLLLGSTQEKEYLQNIETTKQQPINLGLSKSYSKITSSSRNQNGFQYIHKMPNLDYNITDSFIFGFVELTEDNEININKSKNDNDNNNNEKKLVFQIQFHLKDLKISFTYQSENFGFKYNNLTIPILPSIDNYPFYLKQIKFQGLATLNQFNEFLFKDIISQISKYQLFIDFLKNLSLTKPISTMISNFLYMFISPYFSYKEGKGFLIGLKGGVSEFVLSVIRGNAFIYSKMLKSLMSFVGISKSNKIDKESFYMRYFESQENLKYNEFFYK